MNYYFLLLMSLLGFNSNRPKNDLRSKPSFNDRIEEWAVKYAHILLPIAIVVGILLFVALCFAICGVSAVESGTQYRMMGWI